MNDVINVNDDDIERVRHAYDKILYHNPMMSREQIKEIVLEIIDKKIDNDLKNETLFQAQCKACGIDILWVYPIQPEWVSKCYICMETNYKME